MNIFRYVLLGISYFLLSLAYILRGKFNIANIKIIITHRFMQLVVAIIYFSIGYIYIIDCVNNELTKYNIDENNKVNKIVKYIIIIGIYLLVVFFLYKFGSKIIGVCN